MLNPMADQGNTDHEGDRGDQAGNKARDQHFSGGDLGQGCIENQQDGWRDKHAKHATCSHGL